MNIKSKNPVKIALYGATGYVGHCLQKLISQHSALELNTVFYNQANSPDIPNVSKLPIDKLVPKAANFDLLVLATPAHEALKQLQTLQKPPCRILDMSGACRLPADALQKWYGLNHTIASLSQGGTYGLAPWQSIASNTTIIANPGCYATAALMGLLPLIKNQLIDIKGIVIDAKSGTSGAGKRANTETLQAEMIDNFYPYKVGQHQHIPEIQQAIKKLTNETVSFTLTTHLLPIKQGISLMIYANTKSADLAKVAAAYNQAYATYPLVKHSDIKPEQTNPLLAIKSVVGTPYTHISYTLQANTLIVCVCIDNLMKGAASQAIENINSLYQWPLETGLNTKEVVA